MLKHNEDTTISLTENQSHCLQMNFHIIARAKRNAISIIALFHLTFCTNVPIASDTLNEKTFL